MDNKQDRQFFNKVKDFLGQNHSVNASRKHSDAVQSSISHIIEQNKPLRPINFNPLIGSSNLIDATLKSMGSLKSKGSPTEPAYTKNITGNVFSVIKEGVFDLVNANVEDEDQVNYQDQDFVSLPKPNEVPSLVARPDAAPGKSTNIPSVGTVNVAPLPAGASREKQTPQFSLQRDVTQTPAPAPQTQQPQAVQRAPVAADDSGDSDGRADLLDAIRGARAMPKGDGEGRSPEERAANRAARSARNQAIATPNIGVRRERERLQDAFKTARASGDQNAITQAKETLRTFNDRSGYNQPSPQQGNIKAADIGARYAPRAKTSAQAQTTTATTPPAGQQKTTPKPAIAGVDTEGPPSSLATGGEVASKTNKLLAGSGSTPTPTRTPAPVPNPTATTPRTTTQTTTPTSGAGARETLGLGQTQQTQSKPSLAGEVLGLGRTDSTQQTTETPAQKRAKEILGTK
jgi:hypothetical protein